MGVKYTITYGSQSKEVTDANNNSFTLSYGSQSESISAGNGKTLACNGKLMSANVVVGSHTLACAGKIMNNNVVISSQSIVQYVWDKYTRKDKDYSWTASLVKADISTDGTLSNSYACMVYDLVSAKSNGVDVSPSGKDTATVDGNGTIHWPPYWTGVASAFKPFVGHFGAANSDSLRTHNSAVEGETTTNYLLVKSVTQRLWGVTTKGDVYGIGAGRATTHYMAGDYIGQVVSDSRSAYPDDGEQDGYWYIFRG